MFTTWILVLCIWSSIGGIAKVPPLAFLLLIPFLINDLLRAQEIKKLSARLDTLEWLNGSFQFRDNDKAIRK